MQLFLRYCLMVLAFFVANSCGSEDVSAQPDRSGTVTFRDRTSSLIPESESKESPKSSPVYPSVGKIVGRGATFTEEKKQIQSVYFGSGVYVAELDDLGIVLTNWHVVADSDTSIQVLFPDYSSDGFVFFADETWDLAAIAIKKPPFLPIPITLEVPKSGDQLWLGGYGQYAGLDGFEIQAGRVIQYMTLGTRENLPAETLAIDTPVRQGDSGGPILNRFGELAGLLWGSDGTVTMGTFSLRLQAFLTQAQYQLFNLPEPFKDLLRQSKKSSIRKIQMPDTPAQEALLGCGIFPISSEPVYQSANTTGVVLGGVNGSFPPYPAVESPTFFARQKMVGRVNPEVYPVEMLQTRGKLNAGNNASNTSNTHFREVSTSANRTGGTEVAARLPGNNSAEPAGTNGTLELVGRPIKESNEGKSILPFRLQLSDFQILIAVLMIFFFFFNAVRLLAIAEQGN